MLELEEGVVLGKEERGGRERESEQKLVGRDINSGHALELHTTYLQRDRNNGPLLHDLRSNKIMHATTFLFFFLHPCLLLSPITTNKRSQRNMHQLFPLLSSQLLLNYLQMEHVVCPCVDFISPTHATIAFPTNNSHPPTSYHIFGPYSFLSTPLLTWSLSI